MKSDLSLDFLDNEAPYETRTSLFFIAFSLLGSQNWFIFWQEIEV